MSNAINQDLTNFDDTDNYAVKRRGLISSSSNLSAGEHYNIQKLKFDLQTMEHKQTQETANVTVENQALTLEQNEPKKADNVPNASFTDLSKINKIQNIMINNNMP